MKVVFVYKGAENLGIEYLSSVLKQHGHTTELVFDPALFSDKYYFDMPFLNKFFDKHNKIAAEIKALQPDLVAFSVITDLYQWACQLAREIKKVMDVPIVFGGIHPTSVPEVCIKNDFIDYVIIGEGEGALVELANNLEKGLPVDNIGNLWFKRKGQVVRNQPRPLIQDLNTLPFPDKELFASSIMINDSYLILTGRGCPYNCSFCANNNVLRKVYADKGRFLRRRSIANVIEELRQAKKKFNIGEVTFCDDIFTFDKKWLKEFLSEYRVQIRLPFRCLAHPNLFDQETGRMLKESNCVRIKLSPQTMNEDIRKRILKRVETNAQIISAFTICDSIQLRYTVDHILGIPTETEKDYLDAVKVYARAKYLGRIKCYYLCYFPKIDIIDFAKQSSLLSEEDIQNIEEGRQKVFFSGNAILERNTQQWRLAKSFSAFFKLLPILPKFVLNWIVRTRLYRKFHYIPSLCIYPIEGIIAVKNRDSIAVPYFRYYVHHLMKSLRYERACSQRKKQGFIR